MFLSLGLRPSCSPDLPVPRGWPGQLQNLRALSPTRLDCPRKLPCAARKKSPSLQRTTAGAAQEMHRISTGTNLLSAREGQLVGAVSPFHAKLFRATNLAGRPREFVTSKWDVT